MHALRRSYRGSRLRRGQLGYLIKAILGAAAFVGGTVLFDVPLVELLETGTCASGNQPFEVRRECPEGTAAAAGLMVAGVFAALIGGALFAFRGQPPWRERRSSIIGAFGWSTSPGERSSPAPARPR